MKAIAVFQNKLKGSYCTFNQDGSYVNVNVHIKGLTPGKHGFHIHTYGDLRSTDCSKCGGHWNPKGKEHGALHDVNSCLLYTSPSPRDLGKSRMPSSA